MKVLIGCVKKKNKGLLKAKDKYNSDLFKKELAYAKQICDNENDIYILSAKYGLISLNEEIEDYDLTLNNFSEKTRKEWADIVIEQSEGIIDKNEKVVFLCGNNYSKYLKQYFTNYVDPTYKLSLGNTLKWFKNHINTIDKIESKKEVNDVKTEIIDVLESIIDWVENNSWSVDDCIEEVILMPDIRNYIKGLIKDIKKENK